ncbi:hypothetical protein L195_g062022, partial [Trifolium pratense]
MSFTKDGVSVSLAGVPKPNPQESNLHQLHRLVHTNAIDTCLQLQLISSDPQPTTTITINPQVENLL